MAATRSLNTGRATWKLETRSAKFVRCSGLRLLSLLFIYLSYPGVKEVSLEKIRSKEGEKGEICEKLHMSRRRSVELKIVAAFVLF